MRDSLERLRRERQVALIVGAGPGLGAALARRFARANMHVGITARNRGRLQEIMTTQIEDHASVHAIAGDATRPEDVDRVFNELQDVFGPPDLVVYNAGAFTRGGILDVDPAGFENAWRVNCFGGFLIARTAVRWMLAREHGTIIFTGATASLRGREGFSSLAVGKFGLRAVAQSMAREVGPRGIHVAHVVIDGRILSERYTDLAKDAPPGSLLAPGAIAETYLHLHLQHRSAWTHELDLRPWVESW